MNINTISNQDLKSPAATPPGRFRTSLNVRLGLAGQDGIVKEEAATMWPTLRAGMDALVARVLGAEDPAEPVAYVQVTLPKQLDLPPEQRRVLEQVEGAFLAARPRLLGGLFNALSQALARLPVVSTEGLSRMADFHRLGRGVAEVLGFTSAQFDDAYRAAEARQKRGAFDNTLALALLLFARQVRRWQGEATELLQRLRETAKANQIRQSPEFWPATPMGLGRQLKHLAEALARHGVRISRLRRVTARLVVLEYDPAADSVGDED